MGEYDDLLGRGEYRERSRDELLADLAAANARIAELEGDRETLKSETTIWLNERDDVKAENAAFRERITELDRKVAREMERANEYRDMMHAVMDPLTWAEYHAERCGAVEGAQQMKAERDRLQARIDKVLALADGHDPRQPCGNPPKYHGPYACTCWKGLVRDALAADTPTRPTRPPRPPACEKCDALWTPGHVCADTPTTATAEGSDQ
jgi:hypothetical protein